MSRGKCQGENIKENNVSFENIPQHLIDELMTEIANQLLDEWIMSNLDKGQYHADQQIAYRSGIALFQQAFNEHYSLTPDSDDYFEVEE